MHSTSHTNLIYAPCATVWRRCCQLIATPLPENSCKKNPRNKTANFTTEEPRSGSRKVRCGLYLVLHSAESLPSSVPSNHDTMGCTPLAGAIAAANFNALVRGLTRPVHVDQHLRPHGSLQRSVSSKVLHHCRTSAEPSERKKERVRKAARPRPGRRLCCNGECGVPLLVFTSSLVFHLSCLGLVDEVLGGITHLILCLLHLCSFLAWLQRVPAPSRFQSVAGTAPGGLLLRRILQCPGLVELSTPCVVLSRSTQKKQVAQADESWKR